MEIEYGEIKNRGGITEKRLKIFIIGRKFYLPE